VSRGELPGLLLDPMAVMLAVAALVKLARAAAPLADVLRARHVVSVPIEEVVPGDVLVLREGQVIAAPPATAPMDRR
jgi:magnesium-transporting ATPase (P-type)